MKFFFVVFTTCFIVLSCKKDKEPTRTDLLTASKWIYDNGGIDQDKNGTVDIPFSATGLLLPCIMDNSGTFHTDGTGIADEGSSRCDPSFPQSTPFTWKFLNNETEMEVFGTGLFGFGGRFSVVELTDTKFTMSKDTAVAFPGVPPLSVALIINLKH